MRNSWAFAGRTAQMPGRVRKVSSNKALMRRETLVFHHCIYYMMQRNATLLIQVC